MQTGCWSSERVYTAGFAPLYTVFVYIHIRVCTVHRGGATGGQRLQGFQHILENLQNEKIVKTNATQWSNYRSIAEN